MVKITSDTYFSGAFSIFRRTDTECGSDEDISCYVCGQCVHEMDGFDIRQDLETHTIVVCNPCRLEEYPTRDEALMRAIDSVYKNWSESSPIQEDYWESVQSKSNLFPETVDGMLDINIERGLYVIGHRYDKSITATVYPCYYNECNQGETDTTNPITSRRIGWRKVTNEN
jgi:hypothetical protein